jgi:hypothetical protein
MYQILYRRVWTGFGWQYVPRPAALSPLWTLAPDPIITFPTGPARLSPDDGPER